MAAPHYDQGVALNMVITLQPEVAALRSGNVSRVVLGEQPVWPRDSQPGLREELKDAYEIVERELKVVADIQRSLLPQVLPKIPTLELAAYYRTSRWAGGDYYDFFPLPDGRWGILIADVSGHGTPAAVMMAITHSLAHACPGPRTRRPLCSGMSTGAFDRYTASNEVFVTAFYGVYDPAKRTLTYSSAGHNPPRLKRCGDGSVTRSRSRRPAAGAL